MTKYSDVFEQIADFAMRLSKGHIFPDGNKRTTVVISLAVFHAVGVSLDIKDSLEPDDNEVYLWIQGVATGGKSTEGLTEASRSRAVMLSSDK